MRWLFVVGWSLFGVWVVAQEVHMPLHDGWTFCQVGKEKWYPAEVPGVVQTDLLRNGLIPDFMQGSNIDSVQWIENEAWIYKRTIVVTDTLLKHEHLDLVFKGLDTFAEVYLNDSLLGKADNMFRSWEWSIKPLLRLGPNELKVIFRSPIKEGAKLRDAYGIQLPHDNDPSGVSPYIRKAAYQFGWDFCPRLVTSGIWQAVELRGWSKARVVGVGTWRGAVVPSVENGLVGSVGREENLFLTPELLIDLGVRPLVRAILDGDTIIEDINTSKARRRPPSPWLSSCRLDLKRWREWWPRGSGAQALHHLRVELWLRKELLSVWEDEVGFNKIQLDQTPNAEGKAFTFLLNDSTVFAKGANMVPPSMFPTGANDSEWISLVQRMREANMNMVRLWAGGVYPPESFYDACDTAGILVWQDFMFANIPPGDHEFAQNVRAEIRDQVMRLSHHPCLVLWCGNNELDVAWKNWGWQDRYVLHGPDSILVARVNEDFFQFELTKELGWYHDGGNIPYTPTSPLSNWGSAEGLRSGDLHYWGVWHGDSTFSSFKNNVGRFVSEYGFQSYPDSALLAKYIDPDSLYLGSPAVSRLQRSYKTDKPIWDAIERELGEERPTTLGGFIEASQRVQAKAYGMAIEAHMAAQPHCMGTLLWQLNDCWPGPSWSIIDFEGNPKPACEVVKELYLRKQ
ncbi:MAG: hypothetical protein IPP83_10335 [Flavobacteriales bacterium]|nr:hypothetical protein [Flavobacteriales bacterium]